MLRIFFCLLPPCGRRMPQTKNKKNVSTIATLANDRRDILAQCYIDTEAHWHVGALTPLRNVLTTNNQTRIAIIIKIVVFDYICFDFNYTWHYKTFNITMFFYYYLNYKILFGSVTENNQKSIIKILK